MILLFRIVLVNNLYLFIMQYVNNIYKCDLLFLLI